MNDERFDVSPGVRASMSADGLVLLDVDRGIVFAANPIGARMWELVEQRWTKSRIAKQIADDFGVEHERVARDLNAFLGALLDRGLVSEVQP